jgi:hypothetical protein
MITICIIVGIIPSLIIINILLAWYRKTHPNGWWWWDNM